MMAVVLFTMLLQSVHSFGHIQELFTEKECHHKYSGDVEISHQHHPFDHCFACEFTFSSYVSPEIHFFQSITENNFTPYFSFYTKKISLQFEGSSIALRGPPVV
jgi:hypothetical protein